ncbi:MAG: hypothetical protein B6U72_01100 [Candidatus Altiarchaeales archaeon ex4484_2]|nr:MAG: hypothetical protein B6U72_01100 [Candidatus Altiarchaeales archaeon ex4484_2]
MEKNIVPALAAATLITLILLTGCTERQANTPQTTQATTTEAPATTATTSTETTVSTTETTNPTKETKNIPATNTINIDGRADDWLSIPVFIEDTEGDVATTDYAGETIHEFDVKNIKFAVDKENLFIHIEFAENLDYYFQANKEKSKIIGTIYLDTDNNRDSGGEAYPSKTTGFDSMIDIWSGVQADGGRLHVSGNGYLTDLPEGTKLEYFISYYTSKYDESTDSLTMDFDTCTPSYEQPDSIAYNLNFIELKTPLKDVDIQPENNKIIRALFSEQGSDSWMLEENTPPNEAIGEIN